MIVITRKKGLCKDCGKDRQLSLKNLCIDCGTKRALLSARQMHEKKGYYYDRWLASKANKGKDDHV